MLLGVLSLGASAVHGGDAFGGGKQVVLESLSTLQRQLGVRRGRVSHQPIVLGRYYRLIFLHFLFIYFNNL
jgi:hypothetical protein